MLPIMAKQFKLRFSKIIHSFRFCRSKNPNRLPSSHVPPSIYRLSPFNQKSFDISYPKCPNPPPSTPISSSAKLLVSGIAAVSCGGCRVQEVQSEVSFESPERLWRKVNGGGEPEDGDLSSTWPLIASKRAGKKKGEGKGASLSVVARSPMSSSSGDSGWSSSDEVKTVKSSRNFSNDSSNERDDSNSLITNTTTISYKKNRAPTAGEKSLKRQTRKSRSRKSKPKAATPADEASRYRSKRVMESVAVEKRSEDPYGDFKRSMMEMIVEKEIFEMKDLEELLQCFLTLNSRHHHKVIIEAFTEIWEAVFAKPP